MKHQTISNEPILSEKNKTEEALKQTIFFKTTKWLVIALLILQVLFIIFSLLRDIDVTVAIIPALVIYFVLFVIRSIYIYDITKEKRKKFDVICYFLAWCIILFGTIFYNSFNS